ncbi:signal peptidase I [Leptospira sp. WS92.C1]
MKQKLLSLFLNLFLCPFGFYYLNDRRFFWLFYGFATIAGLLGSVLTYMIFASGSGKWALGFLILYLIVSWSLVVSATLYSHSKKKKDYPSEFPSVYWFLPVSVLFLLVLGVGIDEFFTDRILKGKVQLSGSMIPNLNVNDSFYSTEIYSSADKKRGDIVVYQNPGTGKQGISRLIGLPGDTIQVVEEINADGFEVTGLIVNGEKNSQEKSDRKIEEFKSGVETKNRMLFVEKIGDKNVFILESRHSIRPMFQTLKLQEGEFFVVGDNRDDSLDSRMFGPIHSGQLIGKFLFTYLSADMNSISEKICESNQDFFCSWKRFYIILTFGKIRWDHLGFEN